MVAILRPDQVGRLSDSDQRYIDAAADFINRQLNDEDHEPDDPEFSVQIAWQQLQTLLHEYPGELIQKCLIDMCEEHWDVEVLGASFVLRKGRHHGSQPDNLQSIPDVA